MKPGKETAKGKRGNIKNFKKLLKKTPCLSSGRKLGQG